jgi:IclR family transcriptional regulator, acetate operon repressor
VGGHPGGPTLIQSVQRALRLMAIVAEHEGGARAKEVARAAGLPLATTYHVLRTCAHEGWLQRLDDGCYVLGHRMDVVRAHGSAARGVAQARPAMEWLRDELGGAVYLARYVDGEVIVADIVDSARAPRIELWVGLHDAAHATAIGKSILGQLPAADRDDYLGRHPLHDLTPRTVVDRRRLRLPAGDELARDDGEYAVGVSCLAAPLGTPGGVGALGVIAAPSAAAHPAVRATLRSGARRVSRALAVHDGAFGTATTCAPGGP